MELNTRFDDAVSPVVGVILMVAVTVILAAVIGTFVLDLGNNVQTNPQAGVQFDQKSGGNVSVLVISMENADRVEVTGPSTASFTGSDSDGDGDNDLTSAGKSLTVSNLSNGDKVTAIGELEGKKTVLQTFVYDN